MIELLTAAQMRAIERAAIDSGQVTGLELMERAGRGAVDAILAEWPELAEGPHRAVVLCGPGNNGGDGFVVARLLKGRGWRVEVFLYGDPEKLPPDARVNWERWTKIGAVHDVGFPVPTAEGCDALRDRVSFDAHYFGPSIIIDALFGVGLKRPLYDLKPLFDSAWLNEPKLLYPNQEGGRPRHIALDVPSGLCADSGRIVGDSGDPASPLIVGANLTLSFHALKQGHILELGPTFSDRVRVVNIGLEDTLNYQSEVRWRHDDEDIIGSHLDYRTTVRAVDLAEFEFTRLEKHPGHKFDHGHALILSGGVGRGGAARMAARGALRIGAGLVTVGCPPAAVIENAAQLNAIMLRPVKDSDALRDMLEDARLNALCLGPGLGTGDREAALVAAALGVGRPGLDPGPRTAGDDADPRGRPAARSPGSGAGTTKSSIVLDGDALTLVGKDPALFGALHDRCVLTPHMGEFARVFPDIAEKLDGPATEAPAYSKVDAARDAAKRAGCIVLLKGPDTVIADPDGRAAINSAHYERSVPWLATAGAGDVLAGFITGLLARGFSPFDAACAAAWLHVECALAFGPGLIAEDLPEMLPRVLARLEKDA